MATDRIIKWDRRKPSQGELGILIQNYFSGIAKEIIWSTDRWLVTLQGEPSYAFKNLKSSTDIAKLVAETHSERWIEVWIDPDDLSVDVITRQSDQITSDLANSLAKRLAGWWGGEMEEPEAVTLPRP